MNKYSEIIKDVINIYDKEIHPNQKCQDYKEEWMTYCFSTNNKKHQTFLFYKGTRICNELFNNYYECFVNDKRNKIK